MNCVGPIILDIENVHVHWVKIHLDKGSSKSPCRSRWIFLLLILATCVIFSKRKGQDSLFLFFLWCQTQLHQNQSLSLTGSHLFYEHLPLGQVGLTIRSRVASVWASEATLCFVAQLPTSYLRHQRASTHIDCLWKLTFSLNCFFYLVFLSS